MKLLLVDIDKKQYVLAVDGVKLLNKEIDEIPKEIKLNGKVLSVLTAENLEQKQNDERDLAEQIQNLITSGDSENLEKISSMLDSFKGNSSHNSDNDSSFEFSEKIFDNFKEIITAINEFKKNAVAKLDSNISEIASDAIPETSDQLEAIVRATESATNKIIDITEKMQNSNLRLNAEMAKIGELKDKFERGLAGIIGVIDVMTEIRKESEGHVNTILEALSFQDITGQRIHKIVEMVQKMDKNIKEIILDMGIKINKKKETTDDETIKKGEELLAMMKGPQEEGIDQTDVDDIIAKFLG